MIDHEAAEHRQGLERPGASNPVPPPLPASGRGATSGSGGGLQSLATGSLFPVPAAGGGGFASHRQPPRPPALGGAPAQVNSPSRPLRLPSPAHRRVGAGGPRSREPLPAGCAGCSACRGLGPRFSPGGVGLPRSGATDAPFPAGPRPSEPRPGGGRSRAQIDLHNFLGIFYYYIKYYPKHLFAFISLL